MNDVITKKDLSSIEKNDIGMSLKLEFLRNDQTVLAVIQGDIIDGSFTVESGADIRRTCDVELHPDPKSSLFLKEEGLLWLNRSVKVYMGVLKSPDTDSGQKKEYTWYSQGCYYFENASSTYDAAANVLKISCGDYITVLNGEKNGQLGEYEIVIPSYSEDPDTGEVLHYNILRDTVIDVLGRFTHIQNYMVDDMGEYKAMPAYNPDWQNYRKEHPLWNTIPYDLTFTAGDSVLSILTKIRDIYPNYEMFFDENGAFICQMIPSCYHDDIAIPNHFIEKILISEDCSVDLMTVRNMCMVWGNTIDAEYYADTSTYANDIYSVTLEAYEKYKSLDTVAVRVTAANGDKCFLKINNLEAIPIYDEVSGTFIPKGVLTEHTVYVVKIKKVKKNDEDHLTAFLQGQWQAQALNVLVDGTESQEFYELSNGETVRKYSVAYFKDVYNCNTVSLTVIPNSPFTVQKIGEMLDVKSGAEFSHIPSDSLALANAEYENWKNCRLTDSITIKTKIVPFLDVNIKCSYRRSDSLLPGQYIIKSLSHNFSEGTTTWNMYRFYPLYQETLADTGTHKTLSAYSHGLLGKFTHEQLLSFLPD